MTPALRAALWAAVGAAFHSLVPLAVRLLSDSMPAIEIVFLRNLIGLAALSCYFAWRGFAKLKTRRIAIHAQRSVLNFVGMWLWFAALGVMPLGQAVALHFTVPLMVVVLAVIFLRERPGALRWTATFVGFGGVLVILRPGMIEIAPAALLVLGSALSYAGVSIYTRVLRTEDAAVTTFYYQMFVTMFAIGPALWVWTAPGWDDVPALILIAVAGTVAPFCLIQAYRHAEASFLAPIDFLRLPFTAFVAFVAFGEVSDVWTWVGAAVVFASTTYITRREAMGQARDGRP
jgi:drug/metabolite transporter (DMT)-like permease